MRFRYVVVGAGLSGSVVAERIASQLDQDVLVIEKRKHIAGICYDTYNEHGILVHTCGPHVFHTGRKDVWDYLRNFTEWRLYQHRALSYVDGRLVPIPINLDTVNDLFGLDLSVEELPQFLNSVSEPVTEIRTGADLLLSKIGRHLYEKLYKNYSEKQWGLSPENLDVQVVSRLPIHYNRDSGYFTDPYQGIPREGYTRMAQRMLSHPNIKLLLDTDYRRVAAQIDCDKLIYTGPIDCYFDYRYGRLPYRSFDARFETYCQEYYQPVAVVNYPNDYDFTRITEFKHMTGQKSNRTTILKEFPKEATAEEEPYWPVINSETRALAERYRQQAATERDVLFVGRLAEYRYYNMDEAVLRALEVFNHDIAGETDSA